MERKLIIRNFGAIASADIALKDFNIFIGEQGAGKSTVAKLITIFENSRDKVLKVDSDYLMTKFSEYNIISYFNPDSYISYSSEQGDITYEDGSFNFTFRTIRQAIIYTFRQNASSFSRSIATLVLSKAPIPVTLLEFASFYEKAKNLFVNYQVPIFNIIFQVREASENLVLSNYDKIIPFKDASSGIQSVVPLLMVIDYITKEQSDTHFVIEEPELNLFPETQIALLQHIVKECHQLTITTHSPYLLSALNNMLEAGNVSKLHPEKEEEIAALMPKSSWVDFNKITAYKIEKGHIISILDKEYNIIVADQIDSTSDEQGRIFSSLLDLE